MKQKTKKARITIFSTLDGSGDIIISNIIQRDQIFDILQKFLRFQDLKKKKSKIPMNREVYKIYLEFDYETEEFKTKHNVGSESLVSGIVLDFAVRIDSIPVKKMKEKGKTQS